MRIREPIKPKGYEHLRTLYEVNNLLRQAEADGLNIDAILPRILRVAAKELEAETGTIIIIDQELNIEYGWKVDGQASYEAQHVPFLDLVFKEGIAGLATRSQSTVRIDNTLTDDRWLPRPNHITTRAAWSAICTPLIVRQKPFGAITLTKPGVRQFDHSDIELLQAIASQAAGTIGNARLYTATNRQLEEAELFNKASRALNSTLDIDNIMESMLAQMNDLLNAEAISIARVDGNELVYTSANGVGSEAIVGLRLPSNQGISGWVMEHAAPALVNNPREDSRFGRVGYKRTGYETRAMICAPLEAQGQVLGTIQAINPQNGRFTKADLNVLMRLAGLASSAIANAEQFKATQAAEKRYVNLFEDIIDPIIITSKDGIIREVNRRASTFLGYSRHQLLGESINSLHGTDIFDLGQEVLSDTTGQIKIIESQVISRGDIEIPVEIHMKRTVGHNIDELQWIYHDISKQVELDQMRNDLTAMLFHDLQNPLSNVISSLELLEGEMPEDNEIASMMIMVASRSSQRLRHLIRSLLDINQLEAGHPVRDMRAVDINIIFDYVAEMMEAPLERRNIKLAIEIDPSITHLNVNKDMIERVIINLMDNAVKFSKRDDTLTLSAVPAKEPNCVIVSIADEGPGIPEQFRKSIFDKFYRTPNNPSKGIGLGLAFCRLAVEAHGGEIWAGEAESGGAKFSLTLPTPTLEEQ